MAKNAPPETLGPAQPLDFTMLLALLLAATAAPFAPQAVPKPAASFAVSHEAVDCVVADKHPRLEARFPEGVEIAAARVFFRGSSPEWYSVAMKAEGPVFSGVLPSPKKNLKEFHYYIEATSQTMETARTADRSTRVVTAAGDCRGLVSATAASAASILVQGPAGVAAVPSGFASAGVAAAGGGISGTTLVVVGAGVVGAGALAATQLSGGDSNEYAGPVSGNMTFDFGGCKRVEQLTVTLVISLQSATGGDTSSENGKSQVLSSTCPNGPQAGAVDVAGFPVGPVVRSGDKVSYSASEAVASGDGHVDFNGVITGNTITGTFVFTRRITIDNPPAVGVLSTPVVLNLR